MKEKLSVEEIQELLSKPLNEMSTAIVQFEKSTRGPIKGLLKVVKIIVSTLDVASKEMEVYESKLEENKALIEAMSKEIDEIKKKTILSEDNANRSGRPPLSDEEIDFIRELRRMGLSQRAVAERVGVANGTVAKYDLLEKNKNEQKEDVNDEFDIPFVASKKKNRETNSFGIK